MSVRKYLLNIIKILAYPQSTEDELCGLCEDLYTDTAEHYIMRCQTLVHIRTRCWDNTLDNVNCVNEADLLGRSDEDIFEILLGKLWNKFDYASQEHCDFLCQVSRHISDLMWII